MEYRSPLVLGLEIDKVFGVEETRSVRTVVRPSYLAGNHFDFGKRSQQNPRLIGDAHALGWAGARRERSAHPDSPFIEMRQEFRADHATDHQEHGNCESRGTDSDGYETVLDGPFQRHAVSLSQKVHKWVVPFLYAVTELHQSQHRRDEYGKDQRTEQRERNRPGHGLEEAPLDALQGKNWQVRSDDDGARVEDRP